jgi:hypothetical protein
MTVNRQSEFMVLHAGLSDLPNAYMEQARSP